MSIHPASLIRRALLLAAAGASVSCGGGGNSTGGTGPVTPVLTTINVSISNSAVNVGSTVNASASGFDQNGAAIALGTISWSVGSATIASITSSGVVTGLVAGSTSVTATVGAKQGSANLSVVPPAPVATITLSATTLNMIVGATQAIAATERDAAGNILSGRVVTWATSAAGVATVSTSGVITAVAVGSATITATSEGKTATVAVTVATATASLTLAAAGQSQVYLNSPNFSQTLAVTAGSQYLIAVVNTDATNTQIENFSLTGSFAGSAATAGVAASRVFPSAQQSTAGPTYALSAQDRINATAMRLQAQNHMAMLESNRAIYARMNTPAAAAARARATSGRSAPSSAAVISQTVGTVNKLYVRKSGSTSCTSADSIGGRTVAVGQHVIVVADTNNTTWTAANRPDTSFYQTFANEYDNVTWPHILANIGNPLAIDAQLSSVGKITVVFTPLLNNIAGTGGGGSIVAFVNGCDFFPYAASGPNADLSNFTEIYYSWVAGSNGFSVATWQNQVRATAAHETKHIVSFASRINQNSPAFEQIWLEEGLAQESAEIWERGFNKATWKGQATFNQTVACEINLGANAPCDISGTLPYNLVGSHLPFFFSYLKSEMSNVEGLGFDTFANYGAGWVIARWATDHYAGAAEGAFVKSLIAEPTLVGLANLSAHTSQTIPFILTYFNMATAIFQPVPTFTNADVRMTVPSFNFADIFNIGQTKLTCGGTPCGLFTTSGQPVVPVQPTAIASGVISQTVFSIPGTSASYFLLNGSATGIQSLNLLTSSGAALSTSSGLRVVVLRVQ